MNSLSKILLLLFSPFLFQCSDPDDQPPQDCKDVLCTDQYVSLSVSVVDKNNSPIPLDSYTVFSFEKNKFITPEYTQEHFNLMVTYNSYTIFTDRFAQEYQNRTTQIRFAGQVKGKEVAASNFTVGANCCHVSLISGDTTIILN